MKRFSLVALAIFLIGAVAVGCGTDDDAELVADNDEQAAPADGETADLPEWTVGVVNVLAASPASSRIESHIQDAGDALGWEILTHDGEGDPANMAAGVQAYVDQGVDAIITISVDPEVAQPQLEAAQARNIPVIQAGGPITKPNDYAASYEENDAAMGAYQAKFIADYLDGVGDIALFDSDIIVTFQHRVAGRDAVLERYPGINVVARHEADLGDPAGDALRACRDMVEANPSIEAIWVLIDAALPTCAQALRAAGREDEVILQGIYANPDNVAALRNEPSVAAITHPWVEQTAWVAMDQLAQLAATGEEIDPAAMEADPVWITNYTKDNIPAEDEAPPIPFEFEQQFLDRWEAEYGI